MASSGAESKEEKKEGRGEESKEEKKERKERKRQASPESRVSEVHRLVEGIDLEGEDGGDEDESSRITSKRKPKKLIAHVPCLGWAYSQAPTKDGPPEIRTPIIVNLVKGKKKRETFYQF